MAFNGTIRRVQPLDLLTYRRASAVAYEYSFTYGKDAQTFYDEAMEEAKAAHDISVRYPMHKYIAEMDGKFIAGMCPYPYVVAMDGGDARMAGIAGVLTLPTYRRHGAVRALFRQMMLDEREAGTEWSVLYPFSQAYYEKFGYALSEPNAEWSFSIKHLRPSADAGHNFTLHEGGADIEGFITAYERQPMYNMMVKRELCSYSKIIYANPVDTNNYAYLCRDAAGEPRGYAVWHKEWENGLAVMQMTELVFDTVETLRAIMRFAATFASNYARVCFDAPFGLNLEALCTDFKPVAGGDLRCKVNPCNMARVVNIENAVKLAKPRGMGEAAVRVHDPLLGETRTLGLRWKDGTWLDIGETALEPDAEMGIGAFSQLLLGRFDAVDFPYVADASFTNADKLNGIFYRKRIHIKNSF